MRLHYTEDKINVVEGNRSCFSWQSHVTCKHCGKMYFLNDTAYDTKCKASRSEKWMHCTHKYTHTHMCVCVCVLICPQPTLDPSSNVTRILKGFLLTEERQCTYNVTFRRGRAAIVAVQKQHVLHILSVLSSMQFAGAIPSSVAYQALQHISTLSHNDTSFRQTVVQHSKVCFDFLYNSVWTISRSKKN